MTCSGIPEIFFVLAGSPTSQEPPLSPTNQKIVTLARRTTVKVIKNSGGQDPPLTFKKTTPT